MLPSSGKAAATMGLTAAKPAMVAAGSLRPSRSRAMARVARGLCNMPTLPDSWLLRMATARESNVATGSPCSASSPDQSSTRIVSQRNGCHCPARCARRGELPRARGLNQCRGRQTRTREVRRQAPRIADRFGGLDEAVGGDHRLVIGTGTVSEHQVRPGGRIGVPLRESRARHSSTYRSGWPTNRYALPSQRLGGVVRHLIAASGDD